MIFRKAGYFYWLSRYLIRALDTIRLVEAYWPLCWDGGKGRSEGALARLHQALRMSVPGPISGPAGELFWFLEAVENPLSVRSSIEAAQSNARLLREELPEELWELLGGLAEGTPALRVPVLETPFPRTPFVLQQQRISAFSEIARSSLVQGAALDCLALGQGIEEMGNLAAALNALVPGESGSPPPSAEDKAAVLRGFSCHHAYRAIYGPFYEEEAFCRALLADRRLPKSFAALLHSVSTSLGRLERNSVYPLSSASEAALALGSALVSLGSTPKKRLSDFLVELQIGCSRIHQALEKALGQ